MGNNFDRLKRVGILAAGMAAAAPEAQANLVHLDSETPRHEMAKNVHYEDAQTKDLMFKWGVEFMGTDVRLRMDNRDSGRPLQAGKSNRDITFGHEGTDTITINWVEPDGDHGTVWIKSGKEVGSRTYDVGQPDHRGSGGDHQQAKGEPGPHLIGMHADKPPPPPGKKWYYHNPSHDREGYWYLAPIGSR